MALLSADPAFAAYEAMAEHYDEFTAGYEHDRWLGTLEALAREHGLRGRRVLDVACGTGKSFAPLVALGYRVTACDLSPAMVRRATRRAAGHAEVLVADMRALPQLGEFDLVTCLDDALNYLLTQKQLVDALRGMARQLSPDGVLLFDLNTIAAYRTTFVARHVQTTGDWTFRWTGDGRDDLAPGSLTEATVEVSSRRSGERSISRHVQRHHPPAQVRRALAAAGLVALHVYGQLPGVRLEVRPDERRHSKLVWLTTHACRARGPSRG